MESRDTGTIIAVVLLVVLVFVLLGGGMMIMAPGMMGFGAFGFSPIWGIVTMLVWILIVGGVVWLVISLLQQGRPAGTGPTTTGDSALNILRERYARGEITREQFEQMRQDLENK